MIATVLAVVVGCSDRPSGESGDGDGSESAGDGTSSADESSSGVADDGSSTEESGGSTSGGLVCDDPNSSLEGDHCLCNSGYEWCSGDPGDFSCCEIPGTTGTSGTGGTTGGADCGALDEAACDATPGCASMPGQQFVPDPAGGSCLDAGPVFLWCMPAEPACLPATMTVCIGDEIYEAWSQCPVPDGVMDCQPPGDSTGEC